MSSTAKIALALALCMPAAALASCGGEDAQLLPGDTAREITANLDKVRELSDEGDCVGAESAAQEVGEQIEELGGIDEKLKRALLEGAERLNEVIAECEEAVVETAPTTVPPETAEEEREREKEEKAQEKEAKEREKAEKEKEKEEKPEPPPSSGELPPQAEGEGKGTEKGPPAAEGEEEIGPSGGVSPGSPVGEGE